MPAGHVGMVGALGEQGAHVFVEERMDEIMADLVHRHQDESPKVGTWVRDRKKRRVDVLLPAEKQVEVDGSGFL